MQGRSSAEGGGSEADLYVGPLDIKLWLFKHTLEKLRKVRSTFEFMLMQSS
jgi:hypothetical protein